jgi:transposase
MSKTYRPWTPEQDWLLPPSPSEWLPDDHLVYFVLDVVGALDLSAIERRYQEKDPRGEKPHDPRMMTALLLYAYCVGLPSSRRIERATFEDVAFRVLTGDQHPDHTRISEFRRQNLAELKALFVQVLRLCRKAGLVKLGHVALDGTKLKANASKHKAMSYDRMKKAEEELAAQVEAMLARAEAADTTEDEQYGPGRRGDELPEELRRRQSRLKRIRQAKKELEAEAAASTARKRRQTAAQARDAASKASAEERAKAEQRAQKAEAEASEAEQQARRKAKEAGLPEPTFTEPDAGDMPGHQVQADAEGQPKPKAQRNFTDPDSRIMKRGTDFLQGYNAQAAVDDAHQIIIAEGVSNQPPDAEHLEPMLERIRSNCEALPKRFSSDAGYWSEANAEACAALGVDAHIATEKLKHGELPPAVRGRPPKDLDAKGRMRRKLRTKKGRAIYARRKAIVEPVFGQIKAVRGFRQFLLRGLEKVRGEWSLICTTHNLLKLYRAGLAT